MKISLKSQLKKRNRGMLSEQFLTVHCKNSCEIFSIFDKSSIQFFLKLSSDIFGFLFRKLSLELEALGKTGGNVTGKAKLLF